MARAHQGSILGAKGFPIAIDYQDILFPLHRHLYSGRGHRPYLSVCNYDLDTVKFGDVFAFNSARTNGMGVISQDPNKLKTMFSTFFSGAGTTVNELYGQSLPLNNGTPNVNPTVSLTANNADAYCGMQDEANVQIFNGSIKKLPITAGQPFTFSVWAKGSKGGEQMEMMLFDYPGDTAYYGGYVPTSSMKTLTTQWQKYSVTQAAARAGSTRCWGRVDVEQAGKKVYLTAPQMEAKAFSTSFITGTQSGNSSLSYLNFPFPTQSFTVNCWVKLHGKNAGSYHPIFEVCQSAHQYNRLLFMMSGGESVSYWSANSSVETGGTANYSFNIGEWYMITLTFNGFVYGIYINGVLAYGSAPLPISPVFLNDGVMLNIGGRHWGTFEGNITDFLVSPRAWSNQEIEALYDSGSRLQDPYSIIQDNGVY